MFTLDEDWKKFCLATDADKHPAYQSFCDGFVGDKLLTLGELISLWEAYSAGWEARDEHGLFTTSVV